MEYKSLYRKYRPLTFDDVVEQSYIVRILRNQVMNKNVAHAYLFTGTRGTGKTTLARIFAKAINCENPQNGNPCGKCPSCVALSNGSSDLFELDAASNNGVDNVRALVDSVQYLPMQTKYKVYIIDEVHMFSTSAFNALLKTIEEPPEYCVFILATTEPQKIPDTILSRCIKLDYRLVSTNGCFDLIKTIFDKESIKYTDDAVMAIAEAGQGSVRDSLSIAETCIGATTDELNYDTVIEVLGANSPIFVLELVENVLKGDLSASLSQINYSASVGKNMAVLARDITKYLRDVLIVKTDKNSKEYLHLPVNIFDKVAALSEEFSSEEILNCIEIISGTDSLMRYSSSPRYVLETAIAKCVATTNADIVEQIARINRIEKEIEKGISVTKYIKETRLVSEVMPVTQTVTPLNEVDSETLPFDVGGTELDAVDSVPFDVETEAPAVDPLEKQGEQAINDKEESEKITPKPSFKSINKAKSYDFKGFLIRKLKETDKKMLVAFLSAEDVKVNVYSKKVEIFVQNEFDKTVFEDAKEVLQELTNEYFEEVMPIEINLFDNKQVRSSEDFQNYFDKSKIKINR